MEPRVSILTLGVKSLDRSLAFYHKGLGFPTTGKPEQGIIFFQTGGVCLALYPWGKLAEDLGTGFSKGDGSSEDRRLFSGVTLAHNPRTREEVDEVLRLAEEAGATIVKPAQDTFWGGYSGYFSDPDGHLWEVAYGAFEIRDDGSLVIP